MFFKILFGYFASLCLLQSTSLGNHEFDEAVEGVVPFIRNVSAPILAANLNLDNVPELQNEPNLRNSVVLDVRGVKIGIIGYLTPETSFLAPKNKVKYEDEVIALKREVAKLKNQNIKILIALGHSGYIKDLEIAREVEDLDLVIGGHSNTFLWNRNSTESPEYPQGHYPTWVTQASGRKVPVVQAYAFTKYMGKLHVIFDSEGEIFECDGEPILLNQDIPKDPKLLHMVRNYHAQVDAINNEVVGSSLGFLNGYGCRIAECNLGNAITDSMLYYTKQYYYDLFPDVNIAVVQGGRIRTSINKPGEKPFNLTRGDLITVLPFSDTLTIVTMNGTILLQALEHSIDTWRLVDSTGQFLQVSGLKVVYDLAKPPGSRVVAAQAVCSNCSEIGLADVQQNYFYKMLMCTFLADGGDGFAIFEGLEKEPVMYDEVISMIDYLKKYSPINPTVTGRIILLNKDNARDVLQIKNNENNVVREGRALQSSATSISGNIYIFLLLLFLHKCF